MSLNTHVSSATSYDHDRLDLNSIRAVIVSVNNYIDKFLGNVVSWKELKLKCTSLAHNQKQEYLEFSQHSVLSNLYWGIDSIEAAIQSKWPEERASRLRNSERMLQVPALLEEHGTTAGIPNHYLICSSYFYLSVVKKLQRDDWQVAMHFLQAFLVSPRLVRKVLAPELCEAMFPGKGITERQKLRGHKTDEDEATEGMKQVARRYKDWLMYYQVMFYGEMPKWNNGNGEYVKCLDNELQCSLNRDEPSRNAESFNSVENECNWNINPDFAKVHPLDPGKETINNTKFVESGEFDHMKKCKKTDQMPKLQLTRRGRTKMIPNTKRLQDMLEEPQSETPSSFNSSRGYAEELDSEVEDWDDGNGVSSEIIKVQDLESETNYRVRQDLCSTSDSELNAVSGTTISLDSQDPASEEAEKILSGRLLKPASKFDLSILELKVRKPWIDNPHLEDGHIQTASENTQHQLFHQLTATSRNSQRLVHRDDREVFASKSNLSIQKIPNDYSHSERYLQNDFLGVIEDAVSKLCFFEGQGKLDEDYILEITAIYEMLNNKKGVKYSMLKDVILDQLLKGISSSKDERVIRMSVSILTTIALGNQSILRDIKKKGLRLGDLASALKRNVHEAATLIYLVNPSPSEIVTLELLPTLVEVVCSRSTYKIKQTSILLSPPVASLMIIEVLVTAFDGATNSTHLAAINSPHVLHGLLDVAKHSTAEESISLATIIVKCMQFDGECRAYISQSTPVASFLRLLESNRKRAKLIALEFFHEILRMPRSPAIGLLQRIRNDGSSDLVQTLMLCVKNLQSHQQLYAANLLLQLDTLDNSSGLSVFTNEAMQVLLDALADEKSSSMHQLSASILSDLGGTYAWTGESYTVAWLVKKAGLTSVHHRNMMKVSNWEDESLLDAETDSWSSKIAKNLVAMGNPIFQALEKGLKSKNKRVARDSLMAIAWIGWEIPKSAHAVKYSACDTLLSSLEQFLHPGIDLDKRLLACLCIYNYASGKGMKRLINFSEGVRESMRRFSNITWMAEELHKVADYYLPNKSRISCVHTQILEAGDTNSGAVTALIYFKGLLCSGHSDGSIKLWDIKGQSATLVWDKKEHKKDVTCLSLLEQGDNLLSGSADKTIRVWKMVKKKLECVEVIAAKGLIQQLETCGVTIFAIPLGHGIKVFDSSRKVKDICKSRNVKCMSVIQGKIYAGCKDSSIQEISPANYREREIKGPTKIWMMQKKPITSIISYKDWIYIGSTIVEGSNIKEWRRNTEPQVKIVAGRSSNVLAMRVVEDFIYLNTSTSTSTLQIWLRGTAQKVGRISAGSRITSLLTANDIVICGTEAGLIKGWIPL